MKKILFFGEYGWTTLCINFCIILKKLISYRAVVYNAGLLEQQINNCTLYMAKNPSILYTDCIYMATLYMAKNPSILYTDCMAYRLHSFEMNASRLALGEKCHIFRDLHIRIYGVGLKRVGLTVKLKRCSVKTLCVVICGDLLVRRDNKQLCQPCQSFQH